MPAAIENNNSLKATVNEKASGAYEYAQRSLDWAVPPASRQKAYGHTSEFASSRPMLFSFIIAQLLLSFLPLLVFGTFSVCAVVFSLGAAITFALFWIGIALLALVPTLLVTSSIAVLVWGWSVGSFVIARWLYNHSPFGVQGDVQVAVRGKQLNVVKNEEGFDGEVKDVKQ